MEDDVLTPVDKDGMISSFLEIAVGQNADTACQFLRATSWKLDEAIQLFYVENEAMKPSHLRPREPSPAPVQKMSAAVAAVNMSKASAVPVDVAAQNTSTSAHSNLSWEQELEICLKPHLISPQILIMGASSLAKAIYDMTPKEENLIFMCVDDSEEVIKEMFKKYLSQCPKLKWRRSSTLEHSKELLKKENSHVVIENGRLNFEAGPDVIDNYLYKVNSLGGKYICFPACSKVLGIVLVLSYYYYGYKASIQELVGHKKVMIVIEKAETDHPYQIEDVKLQDETLCDTISKMNDLKLEKLSESSLSLSLTDIEAGVVGNHRNISAGRYFTINYRFGLVCDIIVLDVSDAQEFRYSWEIFFTAEDKKLKHPSKDDLEMIASHACAPRVFVVLLNVIQQEFDTKTLEEDLKPVFELLAPHGDVSSSHRSTTITNDKLLSFRKEGNVSKEVARESDGKSDSRCNEEYDNESVGGEADIVKPASEKKGNADIDTSCDKEESFSKEGLLTDQEEESFSKEGLLADQDPVCKSIQVEEFYDMSLTEWLSKNRERWQECCDTWNSPNFRKSAKLHNVPNWNSSRPTDDCCIIIRGILNAVFDYQLQHIHGHGRLRDTNNYLISLRNFYRCGLTYHEAYVILLNGDEEKGRSEFKDRKDVGHLIFSIILEGRKQLPRIWSDLQHLLLKIWIVKDVSHNRRLAMDHPACWNWYRRYEFFEKLRTRSNVDKSEAKLHTKRFLVGTVIENSDAASKRDWISKIPKDTPLHRFYLQGMRTYGNYDDQDFFRYIQNLHAHINEECGKKSKYITEDDDPAYANLQFFEIVTTECFSYLLELYKKIINKGGDI